MEPNNRKKLIISALIGVVILVCLFVYAFLFSPGNLTITSEYPDIYLLINGEEIFLSTDNFSGEVTIRKELSPNNYTIKAFDKYTDVEVFSADVVIKSQKETKIEITPTEENKNLLLEGD